MFEDERTELLEKIEDYVAQKRYADLRDLLLPLEAADIAQLFTDLEEKVLPLAFRLLPKEQAAEVCCTLVGTVLCAKLVGCSLPLLAEKAGFDPAVMASPFISTIVDSISLLIYFQFATALLGI